MNQPGLGLKIIDLRQQKSLTQEKLAEYCDVSTRTIQRIESGEVQPRSFTRNNLSNILEFDFGRENTNNENL
jgi:transcriptional regulator with XRE-family HTH domain